MMHRRSANPSHTLVVLVGLLASSLVGAQDVPAVSAVTEDAGAIDMSPPSDDPGARFWVSADYLLWWLKGAPLPVPLVTAGDQANLAVLGRPGTTVVIGGADQNVGPASGGRFVLGFWLSRDRDVGIEGDYFFLGRKASRASVQSDANGQPFLAFPFIQVGGTVGNPLFTPTQFGETSTTIANPGQFAGAAVLSVTTQFQGAELNVAAGLADRGAWRIELLGGFRYLNLREKLAFDTATPTLPLVNPAGVFQTRDEFATRNSFYGAQLGSRVQYRLGDLFVTLTGKVALGTTQETARIQGVTATNYLDNFGPVQLFPGGYIALPSNSGKFHNGEFGVVPEVNLNAGYLLTRQVRVWVGYNFVYISDVARPGDQIDRAINTSQATSITGVPPAPLTGPIRPAFTFRQGDFWAHGLNFGLEFRF
jgi:hypothetical protein